MLLSILELIGSGGDWAPRVASGFGGGVARTGQVCGAISGALMAAGWAAGRDSFDGDIDDLYRFGQSLVDDFVSSFGTTGCMLLIDVNLRDPEQRKRAREEGIFAERCTPYVEFCALRAAEKVGEISAAAEKPTEDE